jgi:hypothetical protein
MTLLPNSNGKALPWDPSSTIYYELLHPKKITNSDRDCINFIRQQYSDWCLPVSAVLNSLVCGFFYQSRKIKTILIFLDANDFAHGHLEVYVGSGQACYVRLRS